MQEIHLRYTRHICRFFPVKNWKNIKAVRTSGDNLDLGENLGQVDADIESLDDGLFEANLIPYSVTTFIIEGVELL